MANTKRTKRKDVEGESYPHPDSDSGDKLPQNEGNGDPLPESLMNPQQLNIFYVQYARKQPYHIQLLSSYEACISYREGVVIAVVAGRLMNATAWNEIPLVVSCTLVPKERMSAIVKAHENVQGTWKGNE